MSIQTPDWVKQAVFYQIFPDRFRRGSRAIHPRGIALKPWGSDPREQGYQGGDLYGILEKLDYLQDLGITALYLNPIFSSASNHRYHAYDYMAVDPLLGGDAALKALLDEAHRRDMRVVLDGVFNHCGRGFWAFHHILENGGESPYIDWFTVEDWPLHPYPTSRREKPNYRCWWNNAALPKFNTNNPGVRDYLLGVAKHWIEFGADGWRLDVAEEIDDDSFWQEFRNVVKGANPEAYIVGEIWHPAQRWLQGDQFDAVMNYQLTALVYNFFGADSLNMAWRHPDVVLHPMDAAQFARSIRKMWRLYDWEINFAQLNILSSHDMPRGLWLVGDDKAAVRQAVLCQMTMPGAPNVYYGEEIGLSAGGDPHCREAYPWDELEKRDDSLHAFYKEAIALRKSHPALRTGDFRFVLAEGKVAAYSRKLKGQEMVMVFNAGKEPAPVRIPAAKLKHDRFVQAWPGGEATLFNVENGSLDLRLGGQSALVLEGK